MENEFIGVVIDNGSYMIKAGYAGDDAPRAVFPTSSHLTPNSPIEKGLVVDWDGMNKIWQHAFYNELRIIPEDHPVLLTEPSFNPKDNREKVAQIMFETYNIPAMYLANQSVLSLLSTGRSTGVIVESGYNFTDIVPIYEGHAIPHATLRLDIGGDDVTQYLLKQLNERHACKLHGLKNLHQTAQAVKERLCYVTLDYEVDANLYKSGAKEGRAYELPNGEQIVLGEERNACCEGFFQPPFFGLESDGVHELIHSAIMKCDESIRKELYANICIAGGNSMLEGFFERLRNDIVKNPIGFSRDIRVRASSDRKYGAWIGGSIFASVEPYQLWWIEKKEYDECGSGIVTRKCF